MRYLLADEREVVAERTVGQVWHTVEKADLEREKRLDFSLAEEKKLSEVKVAYYLPSYLVPAHY